MLKMKTKLNLKKILKIATGVLIILIVIFQFMVHYDYFNSYFENMSFIYYLKTYARFQTYDWLMYISIFLIGVIQIGGAFIDGN